MKRLTVAALALALIAVITLTMTGWLRWGWGPEQRPSKQPDDVLLRDTVWMVLDTPDASDEEKVLALRGVLRMTAGGQG